MRCTVKLSDDVMRGRLQEVRGRIRQLRGQLMSDYREWALGRLTYTAGVLQQRRGRIVARLARARQRLPADTRA